MSYLKLALRTEGTTLYMKVLEMDERFRFGESERINTFDICGGIPIQSYKSPLLSPWTLFVRGSSTNRDEEETEWSFRSIDALNDYIARLKKTVDHFHLWFCDDDKPENPNEFILESK